MSNVEMIVIMASFIAIGVTVYQFIDYITGKSK
jgi:hypothetical protein